MIMKSRIGQKAMQSHSFITILLTLNFWLANVQDSVSVLSEDEIRAIAVKNDDQNFQSVLQQIIQPRVVGSKGHDNVQQFIVNELKTLNYHVELDSFMKNVPIFNNVTFTNIVAKLNPDAKEYLTLACHYDSKYFPGEVFQGAIDSAVPCAIMLNVARTLQSQLDLMRSRNDISLMLIFFDGEEAIKTWNEADSLYGSRHLSNKWLSRSSLRTASDDSKEIDRIAVLVLIDLIGGPNPKFYSFFSNTEELHEKLVRIERYLSKENLLESTTYMFMRRRQYGAIDDDHVPFLINDVPILHLIPVPFPKVWHTIDDNLDNLEPKSIKNFNSIIRVFVMDFLTNFTSDNSFRLR